MSVARPLSRTYIINKLIAENHLRRYLKLNARRKHRLTRVFSANFLTRPQSTCSAHTSHTR